MFVRNMYNAKMIKAETKIVGRETDERNIGSNTLVFFFKDLFMCICL